MLTVHGQVLSGGLASIYTFQNNFEAVQKIWDLFFSIYEDQITEEKKEIYRNVIIFVNIERKNYKANKSAADISDECFI